jgi:hypothetical protein
MRKAFSMLEVLVVIAIIMIVCAIIFPVFSGAKDKAKEVVCINNMKQLYSAIELYNADYDAYPFKGQTEEPFSTYLGHHVFQCPVADHYWSTWHDYILNVARPDPLPGMQDQYIRWRECRDRRGPEFPVVLDMNHMTVKQGARTGVKFILLIRADSSLSKVPYTRFRDLVWKRLGEPNTEHIYAACDLTLVWENL